MEERSSDSTWQGVTMNFKCVITDESKTFNLVLIEKFHKSLITGNFIITYQPLNLLHLDDGRWTEWSQWTDCSKTCESGVRNRTKSCIYKDFAAKGKDCPETKTFQQEICNENECILATPGIIP